MTRIIDDFSYEKYTPMDIRNLLATGDEIILRVDNTKQLTAGKISHMMKFKGSDRLKIRVEGGYKGKEIYANGKKEDYFTFKADTYELQELKEIIFELEKIDKGINPNWDDFQKTLYFIGEIKNNVVYNPLVASHKIKGDQKEDRSLKSIVSGSGVCASYALILKELCDRNNIECDLVLGTVEEGNINTTHAWNIVNINGRNIPIDATWNASRYSSGSTLSFADSANVNDFIKSHFPGKYEKIQDYKKELTSIDGRIVRKINSFTNKDIKYNKSIFYGTRKDGSKYQITQLEEKIVDNQCIYKYLYRKVMDNGKFGPPVILYSKFNIAKVVRDLQMDRDIEKNRKLNDIFDNILLSRANIQRAVQDGTYYLGNIINEQAIVDLNFGKEIKNNQRRFQRSDGSQYTIEEMSPLSNVNVNRYIVYEYKKSDNGKTTVLKNTIFTEMDLMQATEHDVNILLERSRIDRKAKETNGYVGTIKGGLINNDQKLINYFNSELPNKLKLTDDCFIDYFKEITFDDMKKLAKTYERVYEDGKVKIVSRLTKKEVKNPEIALKASFANSWLMAAGIKYMGNEEIRGYNCAFNEASEKVFNNINKLINNSVIKSGNIDPVDIFIVAEKSTYKHTLDIISNLFASDYNVSVINELYKKQNPSSVSKYKPEIKGFGGVGGITTLQLAYQRAEEEKKRRAELNDMLDISLNDNGQIEMKRTNKNIA